MKNDGFTLIEVIVTMAILTVLFGYSFINISNYSKIVNKMEAESFTNTLLNFIISSKIYCKENNVNGYIYFVTNNDTVQLNCNLKTIKKLKLPYGFSNIHTNKNNNKISIDNLGYTGDACTIRFTDREGGLHCISICVGTANVELKE